MKVPGPQGQADMVLFVHWIPAPPLVGHQGYSLFRALAGCRIAGLADHVPLMSSVFVWLLCRPEDLRCLLVGALCFWLQWGVGVPCPALSGQHHIRTLPVLIIPNHQFMCQIWV